MCSPRWLTFPVSSLLLALLACVAAGAGCRSEGRTHGVSDVPASDAASAPRAPPSSPAPASTPVLTGVLERARVEREVPGWVSDAAIDVEAAKKLALVPPGATVRIVLGTWCGDSRREVPRLWKALDVAGDVPFSVEIIGVDPDMNAATFTLGVRWVPTVMVLRDGEEVGRIVESAPTVIEKDLLSLLDGTKRGPLSRRTDL